MKKIFLLIKKSLSLNLSLRGDSNPRPIPYQGIALPAEPLRQIVFEIIISAGEGIRTLEGLRQRILSPPPLAARAPLHMNYTKH